MKKKQLKENKNKTVEELEKLVVEQRKQFDKSRFEFFNGKNKNTRALKSLRKDIAQVKTIINEKRGK